MSSTFACVAAAASCAARLMQRTNRTSTASLLLKNNVRPYHHRPHSNNFSKNSRRIIDRTNRRVVDSKKQHDKKPAGGTSAASTAVHQKQLDRQKPQKVTPGGSTVTPNKSKRHFSTIALEDLVVATATTEQQEPVPSSRAVVSDRTAPAPSTNTKRVPLYVAATKQHVGKTSVSLALLSGLQKRFDQVGFMKPVGQQYVLVQEDSGDIVRPPPPGTYPHTVVMDDENGSATTLCRVDKDAALVKQHFGLHHIASYKHVSPVLIPPGYTKDYIDGKIASQEQRDCILDAYQHVSAVSDIVLCEGTGHCAVGSIVDASNAQVASWLGASMVLVANGGLGNSIDELELNRVLCEQHGVDVAGVVINKVHPDKYEQTRDYLGRAMEQKWGIPLLGCIPDKTFLGCPALNDLERMLPGSCLVSGREHYLRHYTVQDLNLVATSLEVFLRNLRSDPVRTLYVCHASRNDILLGFLMESQQRGPDWQAALVVTGCEECPVPTQTLEIVTSSESAPPVLIAPQPTRQVVEWIHSYTPKLNYEDGHRVESTVQHYEPYIDFDLLLKRSGFEDSQATASV